MSHVFFFFDEKNIRNANFYLYTCWAFLSFTKGNERRAREEENLLERWQQDRRYRRAGDQVVELPNEENQRKCMPYALVGPSSWSRIDQHD